MVQVVTAGSGSFYLINPDSRPFLTGQNHSLVFKLSYLVALLHPTYIMSRRHPNIYEEDVDSPSDEYSSSSASEDEDEDEYPIERRMVSRSQDRAIYQPPGFSPQPSCSNWTPDMNTITIKRLNLNEAPGNHPSPNANAAVEPSMMGTTRKSRRSASTMRNAWGLANGSSISRKSLTANVHLKTARRLGGYSRPKTGLCSTGGTNMRISAGSGRQRRIFSESKRWNGWSFLGAWCWIRWWQAIKQAARTECVDKLYSWLVIYFFNRYRLLILICKNWDQSEMPNFISPHRNFWKGSENVNRIFLHGLNNKDI